MVVTLVAAGILGARLGRHAVQAREVVAAAAPMPVPTASAGSATPVEVPKVIGKTFIEAQVVLAAAGFVVKSQGATVTPEGNPAVVTAQSPAPGAKVGQGGQVALTLVPPEAHHAFVVVIDPGHQAAPDPGQEPVGPGARETKEKATAGASGVVTKRQECQVALEVALKMRTDLEAAGVRVILTRTSNAVSLSNVQRAKIANAAHADLFVRVHADAAASPSARGVSALYPGGNSWVTPISASSRLAAVAVAGAAANAAAAPMTGVSARSDLSGFNWSRVPTILLEAGELSNADDDRLLANPGYQAKLASGAVSGILRYLGK